MRNPASPVVDLRNGAIVRLLAAILLIVGLAATDRAGPGGWAPSGAVMGAAGQPLHAMLPEGRSALCPAPAGDTPAGLADTPALISAPSCVTPPPEARTASATAGPGGIRPALHPVRPASQGPPARA